MNVFDYIKQLWCYLDSADAVYLLGKQKDLFKEVIQGLERDIKDKDDKTLPEGHVIHRDLDKTVKTMQYLQAVLTEQPVSQQGAKFIMDYSLFIFNCNNNLFYNNEQLDLISKTVSRFVELRLTTVELIQQLRQATSKLQQLSNLSFQPQELSRHYLASFDKLEINK